MRTSGPTLLVSELFCNREAILTLSKSLKMDWTNKVVIKVPHKFNPATQFSEWCELYQQLKALNPQIVYGDYIWLAFDTEAEAVEFKLKYL